MPKHTAHITIQTAGEPTTIKFKKVVYRDSKGHFSKFTKKKKLSVEVYISKRAWNKKKRTMVDSLSKSKKYSAKLQYRSRPITLEEVQKRAIKKKAKGSKASWIDGMLRITYKYRGKGKVAVKESKGAKRERRRVEKLIMSGYQNL